MQVLKSKIILSKNINIDKNYINVIDYNETNMINLLSDNSHLVAMKDDYQFIRANGTIFVDIPYNTCLQANYIAFQNKDYSNKWFFAWIDEVIFNADANCEIRFTIDQWSTWFSDWTQKPCFVKREHVNDDTIGLHTLDEDIDIGELICDRTDELNELTTGSFAWIIIACNYDPYRHANVSGVVMCDGILNGSILFAWQYNTQNSTDAMAVVRSINDWIHQVDTDGYGSSITAMYLAPGNALSNTQIEQIEDPDNPGTYISTHMVKVSTLTGINRTNESTKAIQRAFTDYTPKNNRLYCYPFSFIRVTNNMGSYNDYHIEDFSGNAVNFNSIGALGIGYSGKVRPVNYRGVEYNEDEALTLGKFPTCSWSSDAYVNWLTQNAVNLGSEGIGNVLTALGGAISGDVAGVTSTVASSIVGDIGRHRKEKMQPNTARGNANTGDVSYVNRLLTFKRMHMRPKLEHLRIIDDYLTRFGYKCNRVKTANLTGRTVFNYVEIGANESIGYGTLPSVAMETINNAFRKGVTIWHNHANIGNYNLDNSIV